MKKQMMKGFGLPSEFSISGKFSRNSSSLVEFQHKGQLIECRIMSELEKEQMAQKFSVLPDLWKKLEYAGPIHSCVDNMGRHPHIVLKFSVL